jgi:hypothetical protein
MGDCNSLKEPTASAAEGRAISISSFLPGVSPCGRPSASGNADGADFGSMYHTFRRFCDKSPLT